MKNAGPIDSPTDPFASVPLPMPKKGKRPRIAGLPAGVSPDIFGPPEQPVASLQPPVALPPVAPPPQPWPMAEDQGHDLPAPPAPVFGIVHPPEIVLDREPERHGRALPRLGLVLLALAVLAYVVPAIFMSGSVLRGTRVGEVDIGGLTVTQAADKVRAEISTKIEQPLVVDVGGNKETIQPDEVGLDLDVVATIDQAPSGFPTPIEVWRGLTGTTQLTPKLTVDSAQLDRTVEALAEEVDKAPREGSVSFKGLEPVAVAPRDGVQLDRAAAARAIADAFLHSAGAITLPLQEVKAKTQPAVVNQVAAQAGKALSGPIVLTMGGRQAQLPVATIAANLSFVADDQGWLHPEFDARKALAGIEGSLIAAAQAPRDATLDVVGGKPVIVPAARGRGVDDRKLARDVEELVTSGGSRTIPVGLAVVKPDITERDLTHLGVKEQVGSFTTSFDCCLPRVTNIRVMAERFDGYLVKPGETFSVNEVVGRPTREAGYVEAAQVVAGRIVDRVGGGTGQFATTMYNAAYFGGFEDIDHTTQDYHMVRYPDGRDAGLLYPSIDLKWRNDSPYGVLIKTASTSTSVTVTLWSTERYDKVEPVSSGRKNIVPFERQTVTGPGCVPTTGQPGFTIDVTRAFYKDGKEVKRDEKLTSTYKPQTQRSCSIKE